MVSTWDSGWVDQVMIIMMLLLIMTMMLLIMMTMMTMIMIVHLTQRLVQSGDDH